MVFHICPDCNREFNKKSHYDYHIENKKKPCKAITTNLPQKLSKPPQIESKNPHFFKKTPQFLNEKSKKISITVPPRKFGIFKINFKLYFFSFYLSIFLYIST